MDPTPEMFHGLKVTSQCMTDLPSAVQALQELDLFRQKVGEFGGEMAMKTVMDQGHPHVRVIPYDIVFCSIRIYCLHTRLHM